MRALVRALREEEPFNWGWEAGRQCVRPISRMVAKWFDFAERNLLRDQGIDECKARNVHWQSKRPPDQ